MYHASSIFLSFPISIRFYSLFNILRNAKNSSGDPETPSSPVGQSSHAVFMNATDDVRATGMKVDCCVSSLSVAEYKARNSETLDARRYRAMFSENAKSFMLDRRDVHGDADIGV